MKLIVFALVFVFLTGCSQLNANLNEDYNVSFSDISSSDIFLNDTNKSVDEISFFIKNNEEVELSCEILLDLDNSTSSISTNRQVGVLLPRETKKVSLRFTMFEGTTNMSIRKRCFR